MPGVLEFDKDFCSFALHGKRDANARRFCRDELHFNSARTGLSAMTTKFEKDRAVIDPKVCGDNAMWSTRYGVF